MDIAESRVGGAPGESCVVLSDGGAKGGGRPGRINSERIRETVSALYFQAEAVVSQPPETSHGRALRAHEGRRSGALSDPNAVFARNPNGTIAKDAAGNSIRRPEAGAVGSMAQLQLTMKERAARSQHTYDGYYPSLHLTFDVRENFLARAAYARTYGRPNFSDIIPRTVINEARFDAGSAGRPRCDQGNDHGQERRFASVDRGQFRSFTGILYPTEACSARACS